MGESPTPRFPVSPVQLLSSVDGSFYIHWKKRKRIISWVSPLFFLENETVWLTQQLMADLFQTTKQNISLHIQSIFKEGELEPKTTVKKYLTVRQEGKREVKRRWGNQW